MHNKVSELKVKAKLSDDAKAVVEELKRLLAQAQDGKTKGLLYIVSREEGDGDVYDDGAAGLYQRRSTDAVGQLDVVKLKYLRRALDGMPNEQSAFLR